MFFDSYFPYIVSNPWSFLAIAVVSFLTILVLLPPRLDSNEPPLIRISLADVWRHGSQVIEVAAARNLEKFPHGIFTACFFGARIYVVNSPSIITTVQPRSRFASFRPLMIRNVAAMAGQGKRARSVLFKDINKPDTAGSDNWSQQMHKLVVKTLAPGPVLTEMTREFIKHFDVFIESLLTDVRTVEDRQRSPPGKKIDMWLWLCQSLTVATATTVWGPTNPYSTDPTLWEQFWLFNNEYNVFNFTLWPSLLARKAVKARNQIAKAFAEFQDQGGLESASPLGRHRAELLMKLGLNNAETARMIVPQTVGQSGNTIPVIYATLAYVLSDLKTSAKIREELDQLLVYSDPDHVSFDAYRTRDSCPLLASATFEVMRIISLGNTFRVIMEDYPLNVNGNEGSQSYVLKKGAMIWSAGSVIHHSSQFHSDAESFKPDRFLGYSNPETQISGLFRAFGGGASICSGRHFATAIVMATIGNLLVRFDFEPVQGVGGGPAKGLVLPTRKDLQLGHAMPKPNGPTSLNVSVRKGFENVIWGSSILES